MGHDAKRTDLPGFVLAVLGLGVAIGLLAAWLAHPDPSVAARKPSAVGTYQITTVGDTVWRLDTATGRLEICTADMGWANTAKDARPETPLAGSCAVMPLPSD